MSLLRSVVVSGFIVCSNAGFAGSDDSNSRWKDQQGRFEETKAIPIPVPSVTPFDSDPKARQIYLDEYRAAYRTILAKINVDCRMSVKGPYQKASDTGWRNGMRAAIERYPERVLEIYGFTLEEYRRTTGKEFYKDE